MKNLMIILLLCNSFVWSQENGEKQIDQLLTSWHLAASKAQFDNYFSMMSSDAIFIGTDPTENWKIAQFKEFSKPFFDRGRAWNFTAVERNIFLSSDGSFAWFDELLDTPNMKLCRGSGVLKKVGGEWKIAHYVLSMTIPNDNTNDVAAAKSVFDDNIIRELKKN